MSDFDFINLTPYQTDVLDTEGHRLATVKPSGSVALTEGDPPELFNVPAPQNETVYIVLPAVTEATDRDDLVSIELDEAKRSGRGNVHSHICYWPATD